MIYFALLLQNGEQPTKPISEIRTDEADIRRKRDDIQEIIEKGEDFGFVVHCPAIPGCHSQGASIEEAVESIKDAIHGCLSVMEPEDNPPRYVGAMEIAV